MSGRETLTMSGRILIMSGKGTLIRSGRVTLPTLYNTAYTYSLIYNKV